MAIAFTNLGASATPDLTDGVDRTNYANVSWTPPTTGVIVCFVANTKATAADAVISLTGNGITYVNLTTATFGASSIKRLTLFMADATGATAGVTTAAFVGNQTSCNMSFFQATGVDISGGIAVGAGKAVIQAPVVNAGAAATSGSVTLAAAASANNRPISAFNTGSNEALTERTNWTEMDDLGGTAPTRALETQVRSDAFETTASATWATSGVWGAIAAELNATAAAATSLLPPPPMSPPTYYLR